MKVWPRVYASVAAVLLACAPASAGCPVAGITLGGSDTLIVSAYNLAMTTISKVITPKGIIAAGLEYGGEWTRDISINSRNSCNIVCPEQSVHSLWAVTVNDGEYVGHQYWDKIIWVPAAYEQYLVTGDKVLLSKAYRCSANTMRELEAKVFDAGRGLFKGPSVFNDGISAYEEPVYDPQNPSGNVLDYPSTYNICCLSTNCAYYEAYRCLSLMAAGCGDAAASSEYSARAAALKTSIRSTFYDPAAGTLAYLVDQNGSLHRFQETLGYSFAVLSGILEKAEADRLIAGAHVGRYGVPSIWPDFKRFSADQPGRHNNLVWPHVNTFFAEAALKAGHKDKFIFELRNLADLAVNKSGGYFFEIYNPETGMPDGGWQKGGNLNSSKGQTWCATGYLSLIYRGVFGLEYTEDGLVVAPDKELMKSAGVSSLKGLRYRGATVDISLGHSVFRKGVYVDGRRAGKRALIASESTGTIDVVIY